uniref:Uncharacterized protein n=1 Tax=Rhizophora mucronata TaxID=61149 RepID=A0A2P2PSR4_RHIMU
MESSDRSHKVKFIVQIKCNLVFLKQDFQVMGPDHENCIASPGRHMNITHRSEIFDNKIH